MIDHTLPEYEGAEIINIRRGKGARCTILYAEIRLKTGEIAVRATLDCCVTALNERVPYTNT